MIRHGQIALQPGPGHSGSQTKRELVMVGHPRYLELPWDMHWCPAGSRHRHAWWLILLLVLLAIVMIGSGAASGEL